MKIDVKSSYSIGTFAFLWAMVLGLLLQLFVLPYIFPNLHAGDGLLKGADWVWFNQLATELALDIQQNGWSLWELRPVGQAPAGIAAAIYAITGISKPFIYMPLNALLFAVAVVELHRLISYLTDNSSYAWIGILPILLFPSSLMVYGQLHKDIFSMAGILLVLNTLLINHIHNNWWDAIWPFIVRTVLGLLLIWIVRPYFMEVMVTAWKIGACLLLLWLLLYRPKQMKVSLIIIATILIIHQYALSSSSKQEYYAVPIQQQQHQQQQQQQQLQWLKIAWIEELLPESLRVSLAHQFDQVRQSFIRSYPHAGSMLDGDVRFYTITDILIYLPRAVQTGYLAPYPDMWFAKGVSPGADIMRKLAGVEMLVAYSVFLAGIIGWILKWRSKSTLIVLSVLITGTALLVVQTIAIPNIGTLYRMRLAPWHLTLGFSLVIAFKTFILSHKKTT